MGKFSQIDINQLSQFGYTKLNWKFDSDWCANAIDVLKQKKIRGEHKALIPNLFFDTEVFHPKILLTVEELFGDSFVFHHANGYAHRFADAYKKLHHDHDRVLSGEQDLLSMVHLMIYPAGIDDHSGNLAVVPGSHFVDVPRNLSGTSDADRSKLKYLSCEPGEVFLVYSAVWHGRTEMKDPTKVRYHMNFSYCRRNGPRKELLEWQDRHDYLKTVLPSHLHRFLL